MTPEPTHAMSGFDVALALVIGLPALIGAIGGVLSAVFAYLQRSELKANTDISEATAKQVGTIGGRIDGQLDAWKTETKNLITELKAEINTLKARLDSEREKAVALAVAKAPAASAEPAPDMPAQAVALTAVKSAVDDRLNTIRGEVGQ